MQRIWDANNPEQIKFVVNNIAKQFENTGTVTLNAGATTTTVSNLNANILSVIVLQATSANANACNAWISSKSNGGFVISHNVPSGTCTFDYVIFGIQ